MLTAAILAASSHAIAEDKVLVRVDGRDITEADVRFAAAEIGPDLGKVPVDQRTRVLIEYLIENQLMAAAGEKESLGQGAAFDQRLAYYRNRALRDAFFEKSIGAAASEEAARRFYDEQVGKITPQEEVRARHILVKTKEEAHQVIELIGYGEPFETVAKERSQDPGSGANGGDLGYFVKDQMVKPFADAAFALKPGEMTKEPVETQFGFHIIKVEEKRMRKPPEFASVKERILQSLLQQKAQEVIGGLRGAARIEVLDEMLKKQGVGGAAASP
jgi:peptidyl-prolyl cis-trans isomerase C